MRKEIIDMKPSAAKNSVDMLHKVEAIEQEIIGLKLSLLKKLTPSGKKLIKLKGVLKGVDITDEDVKSVKKSLYGKIEI